MENLFLKKWGYREFLKFIMPSVLAMLFTSVYVIVDGIFVSRFVGINALASTNIVFPIYNLVLGLAIMLSVGASALVSIELGKDNSKRANEYFSFIIVVSIVFGVDILAFGLANMKKLLIFMGATDKLMPYCVDYASALLFAMPFLLIKICFEYFLRVDGKADMAFWMGHTRGRLCYCAGNNSILCYSSILFCARGFQFEICELQSRLGIFEECDCKRFI